jgi:hypothetical protein
VVTGEEWHWLQLSHSTARFAALLGVGVDMALGCCGQNANPVVLQAVHSALVLMYGQSDTDAVTLLGGCQITLDRNGTKPQYLFLTRFLKEKISKM